tara:strand:+ start:2614 stop:3594 length:981 start_codon:yes stop_codon:yes gene_type:complete
MPKPRKDYINLTATPYYHCISRCVRRAYLCGKDTLTGQCYEHRRQWIEDRILFLAQYFAIDICSFAVMSNHIHLVLCVDVEKCKKWTTDEVLQRWHKIYKGAPITQKYMQGENLNPIELDALSDYIEKYRSRLQDISWFMRALNEPIARKANTEDKCTGHFWEGRFKSQALLDDTAVLTCMAYVDLNPIRAQKAKSLEDSDHTSIQMRVKAAMRGQQPESLKPFKASTSDLVSNTFNFDLKDYLELVDATGRIIREDKKGALSEKETKILTQIKLSTTQWISLNRCFESTFKGAVGRVKKLTAFYHKQNYKNRVGITASQRYLEAG